MATGALLRRLAGVITRVGTGLVGLVALVLLIAWLSGMFEEKIEPGVSEATTTPRSELNGRPTDEIHPVVKTYMEEAIGTLKSSSRMIVSAKVLATIDSVNVTAGDLVNAGDELVRLDAKEYQARLNQSKLALDAAVANREQAEKAYERAQNLKDSNVLSRAEFDRAVKDYQVTLAEESRARQAVTEAEVLVSYTVIKAAKNGKIIDRLAEPGDVARPGEPLLVLYDPTSLRLEAPVMEDLAVGLKIGQSLEVQIDALNRRFTATVDEIVPQADAPSRTFLVKASLPDSTELYEGMFGRLIIPAGQRRHLCINTDAVVRIGQLEFVDVVLPDGTVERRLIKTGQLGMPGRQEVLSGVEPGETVILQTHTTSQEGQDDAI